MYSDDKIKWFHALSHNTAKYILGDTEAFIYILSQDLVKSRSRKRDNVALTFYGCINSTTANASVKCQSD